MKEKRKKKKGTLGQALVMALFMLIGACCGVVMVAYVESALAGRAPLALTGALLLLLAGMYLALFLQLVIHEAGHLLGGLVTGYRFSSFRVGSFMWVKEGSRLRLRRLSIAGTGGQCLMAPPDMRGGRFPVFLYNLGGSLMNLAAAAVSLGLWALCRDMALLPAFFLMLAFIGAVIALMNGVPLPVGNVNNDGHNALSLSRDPAALRAFWVQMKVNERISQGVRLKDMPEEWFTLPDDALLQNSMTAATAVFACNRYMDEKRFAKAEALMERLLQGENAVTGLHRSLMVCDLVYCELIGDARPEKLAALLTRPQKKFMKQMKKFPTVLRTEYVLALLRDADAVKAAAIREQFEKCARRYPYPSEIAGERELMELAAGVRTRV